MEVKQSEIEALIKLLDDPDTFIFESVKNRLLTIGEPAIPYLEGFWESAMIEPKAQESLVDIIHEIQFKGLKEKLRNWKNSKEQSLLEGALLVSKYQFPELEEESVINEINKMANQIWLELNDNLTALEQVKVFNYFFFGRFKFSGNKKHYHAPQNNFVSYVLDSKKGNPLSLSIIYLLLAQRLQLPVFGVNLPSHFVIGWGENLNPREPDEVLFYINPFSKGVLLKHKDLENFVGQLQLPLKRSYFLPCSNIEMILRLLNNLNFAYKQQGLNDKVLEIDELRDILA
jgi:regulator of sirC expression with transglutaminase-like and TPR domain